MPLVSLSVKNMAMRENLGDYIYDINPKETPFMTMNKDSTFNISEGRAWLV